MLYVSVPVSGIPIVPQHIWEQHVSDLKGYKNFDFPVVGYGPWQLTGYKTNQYATLEANKDFFMGAPGFDQLISQYYSNSDAAVAALNGGNLDQLGGLTAGAVQHAGEQERRARRTSRSPTAGPRSRSTPAPRPGRASRSVRATRSSADETVRQAIALGINRPELVTKVLGGNGISGGGYLPPGYPQWYWEPVEDQALELRPGPGQPDARRGRLHQGLGRHPDRPRHGREVRVPARHPLRRRERRGHRAVPRGVDEGHRHQPEDRADELRPAEQQPGQGRLGPADGRLEHRPGPDLPA